MNVRVRFAPSPTGSLHLGNARAALYNWFFARHQGSDGTFVLRIEDTDAERSTPEHVATALRSLRWLGLDWDEGPEVGGPHEPYFQAQRGDLYRSRIDELMAGGHVYPCFCTREQLDADRAAAMAEKRAPIYSGRCRDLTNEEQAALRAEGRPASLRFRVPTEGHTVVRDVIHGEKQFENALLGDFIIARPDGGPVYNFANVCDDSAMQVTHVMRGDDHLSNTPRQVLMYEALGLEPPAFAHLPMVLGPDKQKLSKRHGAATVEDLAEAGYVPSAVRNYLALLGWSKDDETTVMSTGEIVEHFDLARVRRSPAVFDYDKLRWLNGVTMRELSEQAFADEYRAWCDRWVPEGHELHAAAHATTPEQAAWLAKEKVDTLRDVPGLVGFLAEPHAITDEAWERLAKVEQAPQVLDAALEAIAALGDDFTVESVEATLRGLCATLELKPRIVFGPIRFAVTGRTVTPGLFESIVALGRERTLERLRGALERLQVAA